MHILVASYTHAPRNAHSNALWHMPGTVPSYILTITSFQNSSDSHIGKIVPAFHDSLLYTSHWIIFPKIPESMGFLILREELQNRIPKFNF